jgi:lysylphosphatidylglycerol synthase-like protein
VVQVTISVATKDDGEDEEFEWRDAAIEQQPTTFFAAIALYVASQVMSAWRWQLLARLNSTPGPFRVYVANYFVGLFTNLFVPGLVSGDAARALYLGRRDNRLADAIASVVADCGIGLLALFLFAAGCALTVGAGILPPSVYRVTVIIGAAALGWLASPFLAGLVPRFGGRLSASPVSRTNPAVHAPASGAAPRDASYHGLDARTGGRAQWRGRGNARRLYRLKTGRDRVLGPRLERDAPGTGSRIAAIARTVEEMKGQAE